MTGCKAITLTHCNVELTLLLISHLKNVLYFLTRYGDSQPDKAYLNEI